MARKLFEKQGIRRRNGQLASGVTFVVYTDVAGATLADISATSGGSAIAGSEITTADIAGLGPAAFRFYGPPSGQDTLYLRCPTDLTLGVQEIEADEDERLDALEAAVGLAPGAEHVNVKASPYNATGDGTTNDAAAIAAAVTAATAAGGTVFFPPGVYLINSAITVPGGVNLVGAGGGWTNDSAVTIKCGASGARIAYGDRTTEARGGISQGFMIDGNNVATNPLYIGLSVGRTFIDIDVVNSAGTGILIESAQNNTFVGCEAGFSAGDNLVLDYGAGGNGFYRFESAAHTGLGVRFQQSGASPTVYSVPTSNSFHHSIFEIGAGNGIITSDEGSDNTFEDCIAYSFGNVAAERLIILDNASTLNWLGGIVQAGTRAGTGFTLRGGSQLRLNGYPTIANLTTAFTLDSGTVQLDGSMRLDVTTYSDGAGTQDTLIRSRVQAPLEITRRTTADTAMISQVTGETGIRHWVDVIGKHNWGPGSGFVADVNLYRNGVDILKTDDTLQVGGALYVDGGVVIDNSGAGQKLYLSGAADVTLYRSAADILATDDDFAMVTAGKGLRVKEGANAKMGVATLVGGTVTVATSAVTANSRIQLTSQADGGTPGFLRVSARTAATSFVITSSSGADTSSVAWLILEPA